MLVEVLIASMLGGIVLFMLLEKWCLLEYPPGMVVVMGGDAKDILKPTSTAAINTTVSKDSVEAAEEKVHQATEDLNHQTK